jgi:hypothetical protein
VTAANATLQFSRNARQPHLVMNRALVVTMAIAPSCHLADARTARDRHARASSPPSTHALT